MIFNPVAAWRAPQPFHAAAPRPGENGVMITPHESRPGADETRGCGGWFIGSVWRAMANAHVSLGWPLHTPRSDHHLGRTPRGPSPVAALLSRHAAMIALGLVPLVVFGAVAVSRAAPPPIAVRPVQTEGVRVIRLDANTFRGRWSPVNDLAPATVIHELGGGDAQRIAGKPADVPAMTRPPPRLVRRASLRPTDICSKHGMHRVTVMRGRWQGWRCRR